ncbi:hypothetical protein EW146_g10143, partial [Bondarzewia mesenterica]
ATSFLENSILVRARPARSDQFITALENPSPHHWIFASVYLDGTSFSAEERGINVIEHEPAGWTPFDGGRSVGANTIWYAEYKSAKDTPVYVRPFSSASPLLRFEKPDSNVVHTMMLEVDFMKPGLATIAIVAALSLALFGIFTHKARRPPLPPGPKSSLFGLGQPIMSKLYPWRTYAEWRNVYGDIIYIHAFGNSVIVLNSAKAADDLLDKRGAIYSSRPERAMIRDVMGWNWSFVEMPYGNSWRKHRGAFQKHFHTRATPRYEPIQIREAHALLRNLLHSPENYYHHLRRNAAALVLKISYGHDVAEEGDVFVTLAERAISNAMKASIFGAYLVDYIPMLKHVPYWFPGAGFKRQGREWMKDSRAMLDKPYELVKEQMASGTAGPSVMTIELENSNGSKYVDITTIKNIAAISYAGKEKISS